MLRFISWILDRRQDWHVSWVFFKDGKQGTGDMVVTIRPRLGGSGISELRDFLAEKSGVDGQEQIFITSLGRVSID